MKSFQFGLAGLFLLLFFSTSTLAATQETTKKVTGYGKTQDAAVANALIEAVSQVEGISISQIRTVEKDLQSLTVVSPTGATVTAENLFSKDRALGYIKGYVKSYDVLSSKKEGDNWKVVINATLEQYKALRPERKGLLKVAVLPFRVIDQKVLNATPTYIQDQVSNSLVTYLTQTGKYRVLDRQYISEHKSEISKMLSTISHPREALSVGQRLGADYILVGSVSYLELEETQGGFYNDTAKQYRVTGDIEYRLVEVATQEISIADTFSFTTHERELRKLLRKKTQQQALKEMLGLASREIAESVLDNTFPIKVLEVNGPRILLSQGGKRVEEGEVFDLYSGGRTLQDPDTGLDIKVRGNPLAKLEVEKVFPQYSQVKFLSGNKESIKKNALVFKDKDSKGNKNAPPPRQTPGSSDAPVDWSGY